MALQLQLVFHNIGKSTVYNPRHSAIPPFPFDVSGNLLTSSTVLARCVSKPAIRQRERVSVLKGEGIRGVNSLRIQRRTNIHPIPLLYFFFSFLCLYYVILYYLNHFSTLSSALSYYGSSSALPGMVCLVSDPFLLQLFWRFSVEEC